MSSSPNRLVRWSKIIREAAEQAGRCRLPVLEETLSFSKACDRISKPAIIGWESERDTGIRATLLRLKAEIEDTQAISVVIGSEGRVGGERGGVRTESRHHASIAGQAHSSGGNRGHYRRRCGVVRDG